MAGGKQESKMDMRREVEIKLDFPVQLADRVLEKVVMRRPTLQDILDNPIRNANDLDSEMKLYARLCGLVPEELRNMDMADYSKLQGQYLIFRGIAEPEGD